MTQVKLNKSSLSREQKNLKNYKQFVPSLDLKRRKLLLEKNKAASALKDLEQQIVDKKTFIANHFPMLAAHAIDVDAWVTIESTQVPNENIVGVILPIFKAISFKVKDYTFFNTPYWTDDFINELKQMIEFNIRQKIANQRMQLLNQALKVVTQRKNLFEKVLIPQTDTIIRSIQIFLSDNERAAVVRAKIAKKKRQGK